MWGRLNSNHCKLFIRTSAFTVVLGVVCAMMIVHRNRLPMQHPHGTLDGFRPAHTRHGSHNYCELPWHLVDAHWYFGRELEFGEISMDVEIVDPIPTGINLFLVPLCGSINGRRFYSGCITNIPNVQVGSFDTNVGRGTIVTEFGTKSKQDVCVPNTGYLFLGDHEGDHASVRTPLKWHEGTYTFRLICVQYPTTNKQQRAAGLWVEAYLTCHATGVTSFLGAMRFPSSGGDRARLGNMLTTFVEVFGYPGETGPNSISPCEVIFGNLRVDGQTVAPDWVQLNYPVGVPKWAFVEAIDPFGCRASRNGGLLPADYGAHSVRLNSAGFSMVQGNDIIYDRPRSVALFPK